MGKKEKNSNGSTSDPTMWMVTFSDLLMLLLTFFVMLLTMKSMDDKALKSVFSIFEGGAGVTEFSSMSRIKPVSDVNAKTLKARVVAVMQSLHAKLDALLSAAEPKEVDTIENLEEMIGSGDGRVDTGIDLETLEGLMEISEDKRGVVLTLESRAMFQPGKTELVAEMQPLLDAIAKIIKVSTNDVLIMGHTDDRPVRGGKFRSNWELSLYRALTVHRYFIEKQNISPSRLFAGGYGDTIPKYSNETTDGREKNRRVEIVLRKK